MEEIRSEATVTFGKNCDYILKFNEDEIYKQYSKYEEEYQTLPKKIIIVMPEGSLYGIPIEWANKEKK